MKSKFLLPLIIVASLALSFVSINHASALPPIPRGCNGSTISGTPTASDLALCNKIPAGCPGSNKPNPTGNVPSNCAYAAYSTVPDPAANSTGNGGGLFKSYINPIITFLSAAVGVVVVISIIYGSILYSSAGGDPQKVAAARARIRDSIIALIAFLFLWAFLQWLMPGGIGG